MTLQGLCAEGGKGGRVVVLGKCRSGWEWRKGRERAGGRVAASLADCLPSPLVSTRSPQMHLLVLSGAQSTIFSLSYPP